MAVPPEEPLTREPLTRESLTRESLTRQSIRLSLPPGWFFKESMTLLAPDGDANIIASTEPLDPTVTLQQYVRVQGDLLEDEFPGYHEYRVEQVRLPGLSEPAWLRDFEWVPPERDSTIRQLQLYAVRPGRGFTVTATTPGDSFERYSTLLMDTVLSLLVDGAAADAMAAGQRPPDPEPAPDGAAGPR